MKRSVFVLALLALMVMVPFGCGKRQESPSTRRIAGIIFQEDQFFRLVTFGMRDAAKRNGVELLEANSASKPDKEIQLVNTYVAAGVDAIVISALSKKASLTALERARERNIPVVTYNTTVDGDLPVTFVESDQVGLGSSTGRAVKVYVEEKLGGKATIAILAFRSMNPEQSEGRTGGFKSVIATMPGVTIVAEQDAWLAEQAVKKAGDILTAHPDLDLIWAANEGGTVGAVMAVRNAGKAGKVAVFGTDTGEQIADFILDDEGILQAVTGQQPYEIGVAAVESAVKTLNGEPVQKKISLPGVLLSRIDQAGVRAWKARLAELTK
jgi:ABC-type sugar transport system substrate-binding protein